MITGTPVNPEQAKALEQQKGQLNAYIKSTFERTPISFDELLVQIHTADWPADVRVHPLDFFFLTGMGAQIHKDSAGPYFYVSASRIRPRKATGDVLDLSEWAPPEPPTVQLATKWSS